MAEKANDTFLSDDYNCASDIYQILQHDTYCNCTTISNLIYILCVKYMRLYIKFNKYVFHLPKALLYDKIPKYVYSPNSDLEGYPFASRENMHRIGLIYFT